MSLKYSFLTASLITVVLLSGLWLPVASDEEGPDLVVRHFEGQLQARGIGVDVESLIQALAHADVDVRWLAAALLGLQQQQAALPALRQHFAQEPDLRTRVEMARAMAMMQDDTGRDFLRQVLTMQAPLALQYAAALALADLGEPAGYPVVLKMLAEPGTGRRLTAIEGLRKYGRFAGQQVDRTVVSIHTVLGEVATTDQEPIVRMTAVMVLYEIGDATACPFIESALNDTDARVRFQAEAAAQRFGCQSAERKKP